MTRLSSIDHTEEAMTIEVIELVGVSDIARRVGVSKSAPQAWERRLPDFPARAGTINGDIGVWDWKHVAAWCRLTGRLPLEDGRLYDSRGYDVTEKMAAKVRAS